MSIFSSIGGALKGAATGFITGGIPGAVVGAGMGIVGGQTKTMPTLPGKVMTVGGKTLPPLPGVAGSGGGGLGRIAGGIVGAAGAAGRGITSVARGAASMCAKYPAWCLAAGGLGAVAGLMQSGQLPVPKRRRRKGISARDLSSFRRVANLVNHYAKPVHHMRNTRSPRGKTCR